MALGRVLLALMILWDILRVFPIVNIFFTDEGIVSRSDFLGRSLEFGSFSLLLLNGSSSFATTLLVIGMISALFVMFGIRTRLTLFICWSILVSFQERFVHLYNGGDALLLILIFWSFFLPINLRASWDSGFQKIFQEKNQHCSFFTFAFIMQVIFVYFFSALNKYHPVWHKSGTALYYVSELESYLKYFGFYLKDFPIFMKVVSKITVWFEGVVPFLLLVPFYVSTLRLITIFSFIAFHVGIELTLEVGNFSFIAIMMWCFLLPSEFWNFLSARLEKRTPAKELIVTYDKDCGFCRRMVHILCSWLLVNNVKIQSSEGNPDLHEKMMEVYSWAGSREGEDLTFGWENFKVLLTYSQNIPLRFLFSLIPLSVGEILYRFVANNRTSFGRVVSTLGASQIILKNKKGTLLFGFFCFFLCLGFNLDRLEKVKVDVLGRDLEDAAVFLRLSQRWGMFAPRPAVHEGWVVIEAELIDGKRFDLWSGGPVSFERPKDLSKFYPHAFWRKFISNIEQEGNTSTVLRELYGNYLCRSYNKEKPRGGNQIRFIDFYFLQENTPEPGWPHDDAKKRRIFSVDCPLSVGSVI